VRPVDLLQAKRRSISGVPSPFAATGRPRFLAECRCRPDRVRHRRSRSPDSDPTYAQLGDMLRILLADRFKLTTHNERRELPVFALET
jgi:uncharacterized protein (TIGR03435 family)